MEGVQNVLRLVDEDFKILNHIQRIIVLTAGLLLAVSALHAQTIRYVKPVASGAQDGSSWADASSDLQLVINNSAAGDEVWVAAGSYKPTRPADNLGTIAAGNKINAFVLKSDVKVYGGFAGDEGTLEARNWVVNTTTLSGDLNNSGTLDDGDAYHVVIAAGVAGAAALDGFTITGGNADGSGDNISVNGQNILRNFGGGMQNSNSSPSVTNCVFSGNSARNGGGMVNYDSSFPSVINCSFSDNSADVGGGMYNFETSSPSLANCSFSGNSANSGGGMVNYESSSPSLANCSFSGNSTTTGGGMVNFESSSPILISCSFSGNSASSEGGGMVNFNSSSPSLASCSFSGNSASIGGGMFNFNSSSPNLANCVFSGNSASSGGGMYNVASFPRIANCLVWNNRANGVTDTAPASIFNDDSTPVISYSLVANSGDSGSWVTAMGTDGGNNIDADPLFVEAVTLLTVPNTTGDLHLQPGSPAINAGSNALIPADVTVDLDGNPRIYDDAVDMGAYEHQLPLPVTLVAFTARKQENVVLLTWSTTTEAGASHFEVQRSADGNAFSPMGRVDARGKGVAGGGTDRPQRYSFTDLTPTTSSLIPMLYYRLKMVDTDGAFSYSPMEAVRLEDLAEVRLYPNPAAGRVVLEVPGGIRDGLRIDVCDLAGREVRVLQPSLRNGKAELDVSGLAPGMYLVHIRDGAGVMVRKLTVGN